MEVPKIVKYFTPILIGIGGLALTGNAITNEIERQGDRLEDKMVTELEDKTIDLTEALSNSTDGATDDLKEYIGSITIEDLMGD